jgi:proline dehydrogenase
MTDDRWSLPDLETTAEWCTLRHEQGIHCTVAALAEYAKNNDQSAAAVATTIAAIRMVADTVPDSTVSIKPTALGVLFDQEEYGKNLGLIAREAAQHGIDIEIDMEGRDLVELTLQSARKLAEAYPVTLALQAYLDRTAADCDLCTRSGIRIRIVKGAYLGDARDFVDIRTRLKVLIARIADYGENFCIGTHDPEIVGWITNEAAIPRHQLEFGFLKGLSEETKLRLADSGWDVSEYVPFGPGGAAYRIRRERYLAGLKEAGRSPLP